MYLTHLFRSIGVLFAAAFFSAGACAQTAGDYGGDGKELELRKIMGELGKNMEAVTGAISREDWAAIAKIAPLIAEHPQPPASEKARILMFVGANAAKFKGYDQQTHKEARELEQAAVRNDGQGVIAAFSKLQNSCLACHQEFRKPFLEHFYRKR